MSKDIVILGGARDYHAMDWYRTVKSIIPDRKLTFLTDLISGEGFNVIIEDGDCIEKLFLIDRFLFSKQSKLGNFWRNIFKLLVLPIQIFFLRKYNKRNPNTIYHAHPMYYMFLCYLSNVNYVGTPQGSEILVRPQRSILYRLLAIRSLRNANYVTVDSVSMQEKIYELSGVKATIIQNGVDVDTLLKINGDHSEKNKVTSIRGMTNLYRIDEIVDAKNSSRIKEPIRFIYPFWEESYRLHVKSKLTELDIDIGRLNKKDMYALLASSKLVISIPRSDSSPRSVYEAIFLGACVAITYNKYYESLPSCMKKRIYIVNLENPNWYDEALLFANKVSKNRYIPSELALNLFDQKISMRNAINKLY